MNPIPSSHGGHVELGSRPIQCFVHMINPIEITQVDIPYPCSPLSSLQRF